jgi:hypothetical protein
MKQEELPTKVDVRVTKLEYFAGEALRGLLANPNPNLKSEMMVELEKLEKKGREPQKNIRSTS